MDTTDSVPADALIGPAVAKAADAGIVILRLGERAEMSGEASSRAEPAVPSDQRRLAEALIAAGRPVVVLLASGRPLVAPWLFDLPCAVLATWFLGSATGTGLADVLAGRHNPDGRLPVSWPRAVGQIPVFFAQSPSGRPYVPGERYTTGYQDIEATPQFAFGHGLSYGTRRLNDVRVTPTDPRPGDLITVEAEVENLSGRAGEETVFLFVRDRSRREVRPLLALRDFTRLRLAPNQRCTARFRMRLDALTDAGGPDTFATFEIIVGLSAAPEAQLRAPVTVRAG